MSSTLPRRPFAGLALTGTMAVGLMALGLKLGQDDNLRAQLGSTLTSMCFLVLFVALGILAVKMGQQVHRWTG